MRLKERLEREAKLDPYPSRFAEETLGADEFDVVDMCTTKQPHFFHSACISLYRLGSNTFVVGDIPTKPEHTDDAIKDLRKTYNLDWKSCHVSDIHKHSYHGDEIDEKDIHIVCYFAGGDPVENIEGLWDWVNVSNKAD